MPGYGIVDANSGKGLLPWSWAVERLSKARNYLLSTTRPDGRPHCMPVWGVWLDGMFVFSTGSRSRKAQNLATNPYCVICPERIEEAASPEEAVVLEGVAERTTDLALFREFAAAYKTKYDWDIETMDQTESPMLVVKPRVVFGLSSGLPEIATRWTFDAE
jgi:nitroimidazol reductase NimA-like FMN-containing flavoprotein (pyridoxamine 5'-phosphate oxidase superfamily)